MKPFIDEQLGELGSINLFASEQIFLQLNYVYFVKLSEPLYNF